MLTFCEVALGVYVVPPDDTDVAVTVYRPTASPEMVALDVRGEAYPPGPVTVTAALVPLGRPLIVRLSVPVTLLYVTVALTASVDAGTLMVCVAGKGAHVLPFPCTEAAVIVYAPGVMLSNRAELVTTREKPPGPAIVIDPFTPWASPFTVSVSAPDASA